jgi:hypothetical protein
MYEKGLNFSLAKLMEMQRQNALDYHFARRTHLFCSTSIPISFSILISTILRGTDFEWR